MRRILALLALLGLALAGCTTTIDGTASPEDNITTDGPDSGGSGDDDGGDDGGQGGDQGRDTLSCQGAEVVQPSGSPYCYVVPQGLDRLEDIELPGGGKFTTAVGIGGRDVIAVTMFTTPANTDELSDDDLKDASDQVVEQQLTSDFDFETTDGERLKVDDARTLKYTAASKPTGAEPESFNIEFYFIYRAKAKLQVNCQYKDHQNELTSGCQALLDSLQFKVTN